MLPIEAERIESCLEPIVELVERLSPGHVRREDRRMPVAEPRQATDAERERRRPPRRGGNQGAKLGDERPRHLAEEAEREVEVVGRRPAEAVDDVRREGPGPRPQLPGDRLGNGDRDEESGGRFRTAGYPARSRARSSSRTRRASASSRQPRTSTVLSSSSL